MANKLSDLAMRIMCSLPKAPIGVTQNDIRADIEMDTGTKTTSISGALNEIQEIVGLWRGKSPNDDRPGKHLDYAIPGHTWKLAQAMCKDWWRANMA